MFSPGAHGTHAPAAKRSANHATPVTITKTHSAFQKIPPLSFDRLASRNTRTDDTTFVSIKADNSRRATPAPIAPAARVSSFCPAKTDS
ncbi:MAG: hypothetical protein V3U29_03805, partial [Phycisphaeraceae bacterium]